MRLISFLKEKLLFECGEGCGVIGMGVEEEVVMNE